ncbi:MAG: hypothetical protein KIS68_11860 [Bauldia sp.]|nr:hypothetical protein [Bauldia sp.]
MKTVLTAAALLASTALAIPAANALQIGVGGDLGVAVTIGGDDDTGINLGVGADANANVNAGAGAAAGAAVGAEAMTNVMLRTDAATDATTDFAVDALVGASVWTEDNVLIGTVVTVTADADGTAVLIVDTTDGWMEGVDQIALRTSAVIHTDAGIIVQSGDEDLKASITAAMEANAAAAAAVR